MLRASLSFALVKVITLTWSGLVFVSTLFAGDAGVPPIAMEAAAPQRDRGREVAVDRQEHRRESDAQFFVASQVDRSKVDAVSNKSGDDWPMWGYDAARSGRSPASLPARLHLQWTRRLGKPQRAWPSQHDDGDKLEFDLAYSPVVMGDKVFVGSMNSDRLTAYRIEDGSELWRYYVDGPVRLAPAAWKDRVFMVSDDGCLHCVDARTGGRLWRFQAAPRDRLVLGNNRLVSMWAARGGPVVEDGVVYFAAGVWPFMGTFVYALDARDGDVVWQNTGDSTNFQAQPHGGAFSFAGIAPQGYLAVSGDRLVVSGGRSPAALFDRRDGRLLSLQLAGKSSGGYRVRADTTHYYNHGKKFRLSDGGADGAGTLGDDALHRRAAELAAGRDEEVFEALKARNRLLIATRCGTLHCFAAEPIADPVTYPAPQVPDRLRTSIESQPPSDPRVRRIVETADSIGQNVLFLGIEDEALLVEVALRSGLHVVGVDADKQKVEQLRRHLDEQGLYASHIALLHRAPNEIEVPPYIFSFIVVADPASSGRDAESVRNLLRPYGGTAFLGRDQVITRDGPLAGAGQWTHQYADAARTAVSRDDLVKAPLGALWYGSTSHNNVLPRHAVGPRPQVAGGRLVILGVETISARDVYTGEELWVREFPGIGHPFTDMELEQKWRDGQSVYMTNIPGAAYIGSPYVTLRDTIYLRYRGKIYQLEAASGQVRNVVELYPPEHHLDPADWGPMMVSGDLIITTTGPYIFDDKKLGWLDSYNATSSRHLLVLDRHSGKILWRRKAGIGFRHNAIVAGDGRLFVIDGLSKEGLRYLTRRGERPEQSSRIMALDARTGRELWMNDSQVFGTYLSFSVAHDILLESGSRDTRRPFSDEPDRCFARNATSGQILWEGRLQFPALIRGDTLIPARPGEMLNVVTGETIVKRHPITGEEVAASYDKFYGCSSANACNNLLLFRSGSAGFVDLDRGGGTANLGGFKSGCTSSLIPAEGMLNAPDYTRTCTCNYQNQTSLGLIHMPDMEYWTSFTLGRGSQGVKRLGVNFGAPGNRPADDGTLWVPFPATDAPSPELDLRVQPALMPRRIKRLHSLEIEAADGWNWVGASAIQGVEELVLTDIQGDDRPYTVTLHFAELEDAKAGDRVFDITLQGKRAIERFDSVTSAGAPRRTVTHRFPGVIVGDSLRVRLTATADSKLPPAINGLELVREE